MIEAGILLQNRYLIERQIGQGGMGAVYQAIDRRFGSTVAVKETFYREANLLKAFEREAKLLNSLRHPALPKVSDFFMDGEGQFLVMEFIAGDDFAEMLAQRTKPFSFSDVQNWTRQLLDALDYLHSQESPIIHRDIKPQNLKLTASGQIILLDFGLAKGKPTDANSKLTAAGSVFGYSRSYASLEQIQGTGTDPRSDLYSLAATIFHLATSKTPPDALTRATEVLNGNSDPLHLANLYNQEITPDFAEVLHRAMSLNSNQRPASAELMRRMIFDKNFSPLSDADKTLSLHNLVLTNEQAGQKTEKLENPLVSAKFAPKTAILENDSSRSTNAETELLAENEPLSTPKKITSSPRFSVNTDLGTAKTELLPDAVSNEVITKTSAQSNNIVKTPTTSESSQSADENVSRPSAMKKVAGAVAGIALLGAMSFGGWYAMSNNGASVSPNTPNSAESQNELGESGASRNPEAKNPLPANSTKPLTTPKETAPTPKAEEPKTVTPNTPKSDKPTPPIVSTPTPKSAPTTDVPPESPPAQPPPNVRPEDIKNLPPGERQKLRNWIQRQKQMEKQRQQMGNDAPPPNRDRSPMNPPNRRNNFQNRPPYQRP